MLSQLSDVDELVVQDACSTDGSAQLLDRIVAEDARVRVWHERDGGQSDALNRALARARNELICWANADDVCLPGGLAAVRVAVARHGQTPEIVIGGWQILGADGTRIRDSPGAPLTRMELLRRGCYVFSGAMLIRRDLLAACGGFAPDLHFAMDFDLMLKLADRAGDQLIVDTPLAALRYHPDSKSGGQACRFVRDSMRVRWRALREPRDVLPAVVGTAVHVVSAATLSFRFSSTYTNLRRKVPAR